MFIRHHGNRSHASPFLCDFVQKKKFEDKVEKYKKEVEITKNKYKQALDDLNSYNARYIEDMNVVSGPPDTLSNSPVNI